MIMQCLSREKMIDFFTPDARDEMSKEEVEAIKLHIQQCAKCRKEMDEYYRLFKSLCSDDFRKKVDRERRKNGD